MHGLIILNHMQQDPSYASGFLQRINLVKGALLMYKTGIGLHLFTFIIISIIIIINKNGR